MPYTLKYFNLRGLGEMARLLLADQGAEWTNDVVTDTWPAVKAAGLTDGSIPFGQMPVLVDSDKGVTVVQSQAIMRHLARAFKLYGSSDAEACQIDMVNDEVGDLRRAYSALIYTQNAEPEAVKAFLAGFTDRAGRGAWLAHIEAFAAARGGPYLTGPNISFADYNLFELLGSMVRLVPDVLEAYGTPTLAAFYKTMAARPRIAAYIAGNPEHREKANGNGRG